ncbi:Hypothetical predicted protein [Mytilus galloprovincialis]|uniref:Uncharacterized protein n=1 Tax=Mytilus galloprovincialis TaxID=29158 RepID=A0A8B6FYS1_MYTGA|nr:Hypothetical predicted protein [Mytilus galloprovincialis]
MISNQDLLEKTNQSPVDEVLEKRKWRWIGYRLRKPNYKTSLTVEPTRKAWQGQTKIHLE